MVLVNFLGGEISINNPNLINILMWHMFPLLVRSHTSAVGSNKGQELAGRGGGVWASALWQGRKAKLHAQRQMLLKGHFLGKTLSDLSGHQLCQKVTIHIPYTEITSNPATPECSPANPYPDPIIPGTDFYINHCSL